VDRGFESFLLHPRVLCEPHSSLEKEAVRQHKRRDGSRAFRLGRMIGGYEEGFQCCQQVVGCLFLNEMAAGQRLAMKHFGSEMTGEVCAKIDDAPSAFEVWMPFFMEFPDAPPPDPTPT
jgi:hypothetical protein